MTKFTFVLFSLYLGSTFAHAQTVGTVSGVVRDMNTQAELRGVTINLQGRDTIVVISDENGRFNVDVPVGRYNLVATDISYESLVLYNQNVPSGNALVLSLEMRPSTQALEQVVIRIGKSARATDMITPVATQKLSYEEIKVNPGGNFDVSKVIQVLPGVAGGTTANRNDIIVRGGGPSENVYFLDGIEIPVLNHFQTQGASGGATGILNVSFIDDVQLSSSAFDSRYDNALASTIVIKQRNGNPNKLSGNIRLSGSEFAATFEGPLSQKTTFMASARRSYLQFLFQLLDLPIRPDYWDFQYKINHKVDNKTELNFIGLGAIDRFKLVAPQSSDAESEYILRSNPLLKQWNYTVGGSLKRLVDDGFYTLALSRNMFFNGADRYENNANPIGEKLFQLGSHEIENKLRFDMNKYIDGWKFTYGASGQYVKYDASLFNTITRDQVDDQGNVLQPGVRVSTETAIDFFKMGAYGHLSRYFLDDRLLLSGGVRADMNTFTSTGTNPLKTLSPRLSASYTLSPQWDIAASVGTYFKLAPYTALGFKDSDNQLVNKDLDYIKSTHYTIGTQYIPRNDFRITLEGFYKDYANYPVSLATGISMANVGTDFSAVGNEAYISNGKGRVYGVEAYAQQKLVNDLFYVISATLYQSEFAGSDGGFRPSTWDYGFIFSSTLGYKLPRNWDIGVKYRIAGGQPYTPFDVAASTANYLTTGVGTLDYTQLNSERLPLFQQLDLRVDKKFNFQNTSLNLFLDFQNVFLYKTPYLPRFTFQRNEDNTGFATTDGLALASDGSNAIPYIIDQRAATIVPSVGFIFEF